MGLFKKEPKSIPEFHYEPGTLYALTDGNMVELSSVSDEVFSQKMLGDGIAFESKDGVVYSPCNGVLSVVYETGHAFGIVAEDGAELLIHIGFDTAKEKGNGFTTYVKNGETVRTGQRLASFDKKLLTGKGYDLTIPLVFTNMDSVEITKLEKYGKVSTGNFVLNYIQK